MQKTWSNLYFIKHLKDNQKVHAQDRCLFNTGEFEYICLFRELITCLLNTGCLPNTGGHKTGFTVN